MKNRLPAGFLEQTSGATMGDQARIVFHSLSNFEVSPIVYLHWHGGLAICLLEVALPRLRTNDAGYSCARFIGACHEGIPDNTGLGVFNLPELLPTPDETPEHRYRRRLDQLEKIEWEVRGMFLVNVDNWQITHAGSLTNDYGETGDGFGMQEQTDLESVNGVVQLPVHLAAK